jgi:hypothetical protein
VNRFSSSLLDDLVSQEVVDATDLDGGSFTAIGPIEMKGVSQTAAPVFGVPARLTGPGASAWDSDRGRLEPKGQVTRERHHQGISTGLTWHQSDAIMLP